MSRNWQNQFTPDFQPPDRILRWLANQTQFADSSWGNDACPSFTSELPDIAASACVRLSVAHEHPSQRDGGESRYAVVIYPEGCDGGPCLTAYQGDDVDIAIAAAEWTVRITGTVLRDVRDMQATGQLPSALSSYADVHDYCDGNVLGDFEEGCEHFQRMFGHLNNQERGKEFDASRDIFFPICIAVHHLMDWWIRQSHSPHLT